MFKNFKYVNIICIVLVFSVLALALAIGFLAMSALQNDIVGDPLDGYNDGTKKSETKKPEEPQENLLPYRVRSDISVDAVYLRSQSYGDFDGQTWLAPTPYSKLIDEKYPATYLGSKFIEQWKLANPIALEIVSNDSPKVVPQYTATKLLGNTYNEEYSIPADDVTPNAKSSEYYRMFYYDYKDMGVKATAAAKDCVDYESEYREFVYKNYLNVDSETKEYMLALAAEQQFDSKSEELAVQISEYVMGVGEYSLLYDTALDSEKNIVVSFLETYKRGTCKHFASSAVLMFRSLGVPARYVIGYMTETVAGEWVQLSNFDSHAWVEIYVDGFGWKMVEVTPQREDTSITIRPVNVQKSYDGTPLYPEQKVKGFEKYEEQGYTYEVTVSGERTEPGLSESKIEKFTVYDADGKDVTANFSLTYDTGDILIFVGTITLKSGDFTYNYNGTAPQSDVSICEAVFDEGEALVEGHSLSVKARELPSAIGVHPHTFDVVITDADGNDVTTWYKYVYDFGSVTVKANTLILKAGSASKVYDGTALTCDTIEVVDGVLADGDTISEYKIIGTQTDPGTSSNEIDISSIVITNSNGDNVTSNYLIDIEDGSLTVYFEE